MKHIFRSVNFRFRFGFLVRVTFKQLYISSWCFDKVLILDSSIPSTPPPTSPIPSTRPPFNTHTSPGLGFAYSSSVPTAPLDFILSKLNDFQSQFFTFQDEIRVTLASITNQLTQMEARLGA